MTERTERFSEALRKLSNEGAELLNAMQHECFPKRFRDSVGEHLQNDQKEIELYIKGRPSFREGYQKWYSEAHAVVAQVLPHRLSDFFAYYEYPKVRKNIDFQNYMIKTTSKAS